MVEDKKEACHHVELSAAPAVVVIMKRTRAILAAIGAPAIVAVGLAVAPTAANAAYTCGSGQVCLYKDINYTNTVRVFSGSISDFQFANYSNGTNMNDSVSSIINNSGTTFQGWYDNNDGGIRAVVGAGARIPDMTKNVPVFFGGEFLGGQNFNDVMSSARLG
ncbi:hypothetical protein HH310_37970 [Actinoplanes sp. TBRC 11911]|uniref:peptidase inhibitor family I36 protein n=1 Tax=Actinoplanes sp. TBRC 11911 TaxID=2729386 RepID=UPI00145F9FFE|nr:peptidase inhibitor family I36 protein [Actinoplanes sp. TBRC 11911]NMO56950.1 hypothetical protein [Actinoplanes sp. TBRC 11911]